MGAGTTMPNKNVTVTSYQVLCMSICNARLFGNSDVLESTHFPHNQNQNFGLLCNLGAT